MILVFSEVYLTLLLVLYNHDNNFSFNSHFDNIVRKASLRDCLILKCFTIRNADIIGRAFIIYTFDAMNLEFVNSV